MARLISVLLLFIMFPMASLAASDLGQEMFLIHVPTLGIGFGEDRGLNMAPNARNAVLPLVRLLKMNRNERLLIAFRSSPQNMESATALYTYLQLLGVNRDQVRLSTQDGGHLGLQDESLTLLRVPEGQPLPPF